VASGKIGTTKRGIGPAYADKVERTACAIHADPARVRRTLRERIAEQQRVLSKRSAPKSSSKKPCEKSPRRRRRRLAPHITNTVVCCTRP
jgi:adenylosuccinate synthase